MDYWLDNHDLDELVELTNTALPQIRRSLAEVRDRLLAHPNDLVRAAGAWLAGEDDLIISRIGKRAKWAADVRRSTPAILGQFRIDISDPNFEHWFFAQSEGPLLAQIGLTDISKGYQISAAA